MLALMVSESTTPNAVAAAANVLAPPMVTCGVVYPAPWAVGSTAIAVTEPVGLKVAVAKAWVPEGSVGALIVTLGAAVYPLPNLVMVMPVMTPPNPTWAVASAVTPGPGLGGSIVTVAAGIVIGLFAQFGQGPK